MRDAERPAQPTLVDLPVPARLAAIRDGELDLALVRGPVEAAGVRVEHAWSELLLAVVPADHPMAGRPVVTLADLDRTTLRLPAREEDPPLHDAVTAALRQAGSGPAGRSGGSVLTVLIEIGSGQGTWTLLTEEHLAGFAARRVRAIPLDPPLSIDGHIVASLTTPDVCVSAFVRAFADEPGLTPEHPAAS
jgi:DNA-binding transcriptional LysR family regulator